MRFLADRNRGAIQQKILGDFGRVKSRENIIQAGFRRAAFHIPSIHNFPLEIGLHVLKLVGNGAKGGRGLKGGIREYARQMGCCSESTLKEWVQAAEVAKLDGQPSSLIPYTTNLSIIHRAPESDWPDLVAKHGCTAPNAH
jgi:hypothetical protein